MKKRNSQLFLEDADGNRVPVSDKVYRAYWHFANKEDYFMRQLKEERFLYDPEKRIAEFIPGKEDSLERLLEDGADFSSDQQSVEEQAIFSVLVENLMKRMTDSEREVAYMSYALGKSDRECGEFLGIPENTYKSRRLAMLLKCRKLFDDSS